jgi:hypothetical protein
MYNLWPIQFIWVSFCGREFRTQLAFWMIFFMYCVNGLFRLDNIFVSEFFLTLAFFFYCPTPPHPFPLTLSPPAVKTQSLSQCQAFQRLLRSSHTLVNEILNNFRSTELIFNQFSVFFFKHLTLFASVCNINITGQ